MAEDFELKNDNITKEVMLQYEAIRQLGFCNMLDYYCVVNRASELDYCDLADLERDDYVYILSNFSNLMKFYGVAQGKDAVALANATIR